MIERGHQQQHYEHQQRKYQRGDDFPIAAKVTPQFEQEQKYHSGRGVFGNVGSAGASSGAPFSASILTAASEMAKAVRFRSDWCGQYETAGSAFATPLDTTVPCR